MDAAAEIGRDPISKHQIQLGYGDEQTDGTGLPNPSSRDQCLRRDRGQEKNQFPCPADHEQDW